MVPWLKKARVVVAVAILLSVSALFLDFAGVVPDGMRSSLLAVQFFPALIKSTVYIGLATIGCIFVVVITILFGRIYCSALCPLGILQDIGIRLRKKIDRRRRFRYATPLFSVHYGLASLAIGLVLLGSTLLLNLLEPYSNFGRMLSDLINPCIVFANNTLDILLTRFGLSVLSQIPFLHVSILASIIAFCMFGVLLFLSVQYGRIFCNLLCPTGAVLSLLSRVSFFRITIDENNCKECGLCERVCKARCILSEKKQIDFAACVGCFNCLDGCPTGGMNYELRWKKKRQSPETIDTARRTILKTSALPLLGMLLGIPGGISLAEEKDGEYEESHRHPISPPGSRSVSRFSNLCTACHLCTDACPTQVLVPSLFEYGVTGILQPRMNYTSAYCNFDCVVCGTVCPTGAIMPLSPEEKKLTQIGQATFVRERCVVVTNGTDCGACAEHCPTKAVHMIPWNAVRVPEVDDELCIGCGACEHACPVQPKKAIYVKPNSIHRSAKHPKIQKLEQTFDNKEPFPF